ncbi:MAG: V-type ATP synthase subunit D [Lachnospiraceae bacterium]|uniref:V-type ATP synthase subunit D n=1 Tax=Candidatus Scatomorpha intestinigallinarum TaxID=2840923 RepID=A0A9D1DM98_9FIRM|nr:V-type ATP synthase subunit D [Candidatus Scatomorpha intestinigallinarum]
MAQTAPTKGNLNAAKRSRALADNGYELMDRKRNILIREIMELMDEAEDLQERIDSTFSEAYASMRLAEISMGGSAQSGANAVPIDDSFSIRFRSVMGVELPVVSAEPEEPSGPPYGLAFTSSDLDDAYFKFAEVKELIRELAETENCIYRLAYAIKKAQKRANALQNIVIPGLDSEIARISDALEEKEREEFVRLKVVKAREPEDDAR